MENKKNNKNAKIALKQIKFEIAADYGMSQEDVFDVIENAKSDGVLSIYFNELENKKILADRLYSNISEMPPTHLE